jgi:two-component system, chemotaxis family, protein-glutamate methylesterase/glutaminase
VEAKDNSFNINSSQAFEIVAIAASADGLKALIEILSSLPSDFPAAIAIVKHISPDYRSFLASILSRHTCLKVKDAEDGEKIQPSVVYIAPPNYHLIVNPDRSLSLTQSAKVRHVRPSADVLFESVADSYKQRAIAVVLTGGDMDGANGVRAIKQMGGVAIAQDEATSKVFGMPHAAIQTGCVDFILPLEQIGDAITSLVMTGGLTC